VDQHAAAPAARPGCVHHSSCSCGEGRPEQQAARRRPSWNALSLTLLPGWRAAGAQLPAAGPAVPPHYAPARRAGGRVGRGGRRAGLAVRPRARAAAQRRGRRALCARAALSAAARRCRRAGPRARAGGAPSPAPALQDAPAPGVCSAAFAVAIVGPRARQPRACPHPYLRPLCRIQHMLAAVLALWLLQSCALLCAPERPAGSYFLPCRLASADLPVDSRKLPNRDGLPFQQLHCRTCSSDPA